MADWPNLVFGLAMLGAFFVIGKFVMKWPEPGDDDD